MNTGPLFQNGDIRGIRCRGCMAHVAFLISHFFGEKMSCKVSYCILCNHEKSRLEYVFLTSSYIWLNCRETLLTFMRHHPLDVAGLVGGGYLPKWTPKIFGKFCNLTQIHLDILLSVAHGMSPLLIGGFTWGWRTLSRVHQRQVGHMAKNPGVFFGWWWFNRRVLPRTIRLQVGE